LKDEILTEDTHETPENVAFLAPEERVNVLEGVRMLFYKDFFCTPSSFCFAGMGLYRSHTFQEFEYG